MSDGATSGTPLTSAGLSGSEGSAASRSHSTRSADCAVRQRRRRRDRQSQRSPSRAKSLHHDVGRLLRSAGKFKAPARTPRSAGATSGEARNRNSRSDGAALLDAAMRPAENTAGVCSSRGIGPTTSMPADQLQFADLLHGQIGLAGEQPFGGKARGNDGRPGVDLGCDAHPLDQLRKQNAAGADPRIGHRTGARAASRAARPPSRYRDGRRRPSPRCRQRTAPDRRSSSRHHVPSCGEIVERLAGQDDDVGALAAAQPIQQRQRRREIGIDARAAFRLETCRQDCDTAPFRASVESTRTAFPSKLGPAASA